jgi:hypothetical protein
MDDGLQQACSSGEDEMKEILAQVDNSITDEIELLKIVLVGMKGKVNPAFAKKLIEEYLLTKQ